MVYNLKNSNIKKTSSIKKAYDILFHPGKASEEKIKLSTAFKFYFKIAIIGFLIYALTGTVMLHFNYKIPHFSLLFSFFPNYFFDILISGIILFFILIPIGLIIDAAIYHLFGKFLLKAWNGNYSLTLNAAVFASVPALLLSWLLLIHYIKIIGILLIGIWEFVILIIALSGQQKTTRVNAFISVFASILFVILIAFLLMALVMAPLILHNYTAQHFI